MIYSDKHKTLHIDIETYSSIDIKSGVYKYASADDFEVMLIGYAYEDEEIKQIDLASGEEVPYSLVEDLLNKDVIKVAHNATFERVCLSKMIYGVNNKYISAEGWRCTLSLASMLGLPKSLKDVGKVLNLREEDRKLDVMGSRLISFFAVPQEPKRTNNFRRRNLPIDDIEKWQLYKEYNRQDVVAEREIYKLEMLQLRLPIEEIRMYQLDAKINDAGISIDARLCKEVNDYIVSHRDALNERLKEITKLENPNSVQQMSKWLKSKGYQISSLDADTVGELLTHTDEEDVVEALSIMQQSKKTSVTKYASMLNSGVKDGTSIKCHGTLQYYGASRTGRWAGRIVQTQNLPRNTIKCLEEVRRCARRGDFESIEMVYPNTMQVMSELVRTALIPEEGERFVVCDYNAIESRVAAWLSDEEWKLKAFRENKGIYEATASRMFDIPIEQITHESEERAKGKVAELAGQYQGGVGAYKRFGAERFGWNDAQIQNLVDTWRLANPNICECWKKIEKAILAATRSLGSVASVGHGVSMQMRGKNLFIKLPSGRELAYQNLKVEEDNGIRVIRYDGEITGAKWARVESYGGKFFENIVQAIARDCLRDAMIALDKEGFLPRFHVHDEVIISVGYDKYKDDNELIARIAKIMADSAGNYDTKIPLRAEGYTCAFYLKE